MANRPPATPPAEQGIKIATGSTEQAPFIYFDGVVTYGVNFGIIQIELAANILSPEGKGVRTDVLITAHLRCGPTAAIALRESITKALEMPQVDMAIQPVAGSKPN
jgi:hypothetical protein